MNAAKKRALLVAERLLGVPPLCAICNDPIRVHSTGNWFHSTYGNYDHKAKRWKEDEEKSA